MSRTTPSVSKRVRRDRAYYRIEWSPLLPVSRWEINRAVPGMAGIWELYYLENARIPRLLKMGRAWYGGLRNEIRTESDPDLPQNATHRRLLESGDCYYRYTICEQAGDMADVYSVLITHRPVTSPPIPPSGRYIEVRIQEPDEIEIRRARRPHEEATPPPMIGGRVPNMFDVARELEQMAEEAAERAVAGASDGADTTEEPTPDAQLDDDGGEADTSPG